MAATWYVDIDVSGTSNNSGTSWANAFTNCGGIAWAGIAAGDTVYISGGTYSGTNGNIFPTSSGSSGNPIVIKASQEVGHNNLIVITNGGFKPNSQSWITLDGAKNDNYTTNITGTFAVPIITNNLGISFHNCGFAYTVGTGPVGVTVKWVEMKHFPAFPDPDYIVLISAENNGDIQSTSVSYCYIHDCGDFGFYGRAHNSTREFLDFTIDHCWIDRTGDDPVNWTAGGLTMHHNFIGEGLRLNGHGDAIQAHSDHIRFYNNVVFDQHNGPGRWESYNSEGAVTDGIQIYGNVMYTSNFASVGAEHLAVLTYGNAIGFFTNITWTNVIVANNTIASMPGPGTPIVLSNSRTNYGNIIIRGCLYANNLVWTATNNNLTGMSLASGLSNTWDYSESDLILDYNVVSGNSTTNVNYRGTNYVNMEALNAATSWNSNSSIVPSFSNVSLNDYRLAANDSSSINRGTNLSSLNLPSIGTDLYGNSRGIGSAWDIGAFEFGSAAGSTTNRSSYTGKIVVSGNGSF